MTWKRVLALWCALAPLGCATVNANQPSSTPAVETLTRVNGVGFSGFLIPRLVNFAESWTPEATQVVIAEPKVQQCVVAHRRNLRSALPRFFRHYSGTTVNGEPALYIQFFDTRHYRAKDLNQPMVVLDGNGEDHFIVVYGLQSEKCSIY